MTRVLAEYRLRDMSVFLGAVTDKRHLALVPEVQDTLLVWESKFPNNTAWVLIGGLALSFYRKPRSTQDVDVLVLSEQDVPEIVEGFKRVRPHAFRENGTHVEVELVTPKLVGAPSGLFKKVIATAVNHSGLKVASLPAMIVLKLYGALNPRRKHQDLADVIAMLDTKGKEVDLSDWDAFLTPTLKAFYEECVTTVFKEAE